MIVELCPEVSHSAPPRKRCKTLVVAQGGADDVRREVAEDAEVVLAWPPSAIRSPISAIRRVPMRHGMDLPHASLEQNRVSRRARSTTQARLSAITTDPEPRWAPAARRDSKS